MALATGARLGPYEITGRLGVGGMGEVYRATDTKLGRDVAIKTLPSALAKDTERLARFEREAKLLAALNHAHIAAVYGLDEHDGARFLALELVEGQTLQEKLKDGPFPLDEALHLGLQIAQALEAAHEKGIVHRDLKPTNIMVTREGQVKVLDFGLAKAFSGDPNAASPAHSPALSLAMTQQGLILGTAGYMSPEQASGQATDQRADIWAFGVVLYEMLTGLPLFKGESVPHILADVLRSEPDWNRLPGSLHPRLKLLLERCLEKKVRNRYHSIADARVDIEKVLHDPHGTAALPTASLPTWRRALPLAAALVAGVVIAGLAVWTVGPDASGPVVTARLSIVTPANRPIIIPGLPQRALALSPDGTQLVYTGLHLGASAAQTRIQLQLRSLATLAVRDLPGTGDAHQPFFSPDGQWVGFFTGTGELKKLALAGGSPITLAEDINSSQWSFGVWTADGTIIYQTNTGLRRISAEGGEPTDLTTLDADDSEVLHTQPALPPSNRAVLFAVMTRDSRSRIEAVTLDSGVRRVVVEDGYSPLVIGGRLIFQRDAAPMVAPFDAEQLIVTGPAAPLTDAVRLDSAVYPVPVAQLAVSRTGTLAYLPATDTASVLGLVGRDGVFEPLAIPPGNYEFPRVSPDGSAIAYVESQGLQKTVRTYDLRRKTRTTLGQDGPYLGLEWHPDGRSLAVALRGAGTDRGRILQKNLDGTERLLVSAPPDSQDTTAFIRNFSWSPDGTQLAYTVQAGSQHDIWVLTLGNEPTSAPFLDSEATEYGPRFSPDGRWLAYVSSASGRNEIYVQRYPQGETLPVSIDGGEAPLWSPDGKELYFQGLEGGVPKLVSVLLTADGESFELGAPIGLFDLRVLGAEGVFETYAFSFNTGAQYDVFPDGERFVMIRGADAAGAREIVVVQNWAEELERQLAAE
jgi:Tol biopolymer transport system component